jgi:hypothetical protein
VIASTTLGEPSQSSLTQSSLTFSNTQQTPTTYSSIGLNAPDAGTTALPHQSSYATFSSIIFLHISTLYEIHSPNVARSFPERNISAVVVPLVLALLSLGAFAFHLVRKKRAGKATTAGTAVTPFAEPQLNSTELGGIPVNELQSLSRPFELYGSHPKRIIQ